MKKILSLLLILILVFSLAACGKETQKDNENNTTNSTESSTVVDETIDSTTDTDSNETTDNQMGSSSSTESTDNTTNTESTQKPTEKPKENKTEDKTTQKIEVETTTPTIPTDNTKPTENTGTSDKGNATTDRVVVKVEDIPLPDEEADKIEIETPDIKEEVKVETKHTKITSSNYYQYSKLSSSDKQIYSMLTNAMESTTNIVKLDNQSISYNKGLALIQKVLADNPQYFWVSKSTSILYNPNTNKVQAFIIYYTDGSVTDEVDSNYELVKTANRETINKQIKNLNTKIEEIVKTIPVETTQIEKEKLIHDYIIDNLTYDQVAASGSYVYGDTLPRAFDIYGAVCNKKAVCEGYSKMFQYLCYCVGINSTQVVGTSGGVNHMWNAVNIDGDWYQVDTTWNDTNSSEMPYYGYLNLNSAEMNKDHTADATNLNIPTCTATKYSFNKYFALDVTSLTADATNYAFVVDNIVKNKEEYLIISNKDISVTQTYLKQYILHADSTLRKYVTEKGYNFEFELKYRLFGDYIYVPVVFN